MIERADQEIKFWYEHYIKFHKMGLTKGSYAHKYGIELKEFSNWFIRFNPWRGNYREHKKREIELILLYKAKGESRAMFCSKYQIPGHRMDVVGTHMEYMRRLNKIYNGNVPVDPSYLDANESTAIKEEQKPMTFITREPEPLPSVMPSAPRPEFIPITPPVAEVIEEQNHVELTITKGVKVILSPEFPAIKIIKIIELLKDL